MNINWTKSNFFQEFSVQVTFREQWNDERLRYVDSTRGSCPVFFRKVFIKAACMERFIGTESGHVFVYPWHLLPDWFTAHWCRWDLIDVTQLINQSINHIMQDYFIIFYYLVNTWLANYRNNPTKDSAWMMTKNLTKFNIN